MAKKKTNPRKIPRTEADVKRAVEIATRQAVGGAFEMMLYILIDKHDAPPDEVQQLARELDWLAESLYSNKPGHLTWGDVDRVLKENHVKVKFTHDKDKEAQQ